MAFNAQRFSTEPFTVEGNFRVSWGTFTNDGGSTGGDIVTGLNQVFFLELTHTGSAVVASAPVVNESFPTGSGTITIVTVADADGIWKAYGR